MMEHWQKNSESNVQNAFKILAQKSKRRGSGQKNAESAVSAVSKICFAFATADIDGIADIFGMALPDKPFRVCAEIATVKSSRW